MNHDQYRHNLSAPAVVTGKRSGHFCLIPAQAKEQLELDTLLYLMDELRRAEQGKHAASLGIVQSKAGLFGTLKEMIYRLPKYGTAHIFHLTGSSLVGHTLPSILLAKFFGCQVVLHLRSQLLEYELEYQRSQYRIALKLADQVLVSSRYAAGLLAEQGNPATVLPIDSPPVEAAPEPLTNLQPKMLLVRPLEKSSNIICAIKALKLVKQKYPRAELVVAGEGSRYPQLLKYIESNAISGVTFYTDPTAAQLETLLGESDLLLNCSVLDNSPPIIARALAMARPVVATDVGGIKELVKDGFNGFLVRSNDHVSIAERVIELIENSELFARLSLNALESGSDDSDKRAQLWLNFLDLNATD